MLTSFATENPDCESRLCHRAGMAKRTDPKLHERLRAWVRYLRAEREAIDRTQRAFAEKIGIPPPTLNGILAGEKGVGVDVLARIRNNLHQSIDQMFDDDPPARVQRRPSMSSRAAGGGETTEPRSSRGRGG